MKKNLNIFLSKNSKIISKISNEKKFLLVADRLRFDSCIRQSLISKIFNDKGFTPILATPKPKSIYRKVYKSFGLERVFNTSISHNKFFLIKNFLPYALLSLYVIIKYSYKNFELFKAEFKIQGVRIGDQIIDQYFRKNQSYKKGFFTFKFFKLMLTAYFKVNLIQSFIIRKKIKYTLVSTDCYLNESSTIFRISQKLKLKCIYSVRKSIKVYSNAKEYNEHIYTVKKSDIKNLKSHSKIKKYLTERFHGNIDHLDVKNAYSNKIKRFTKNNFLDFFKIKHKNFRKIILFAPHVFADCCSTYGQFPFLNYYNFFTETYNQLTKIKDIFWIIKPHPTRHFWKEDDIIKDILGKNKIENIFLCPDKISTKDLLKYVDTVVTGRGTIAVESAIFGKKALTCGSSIYSELNITFQTKTKKEFFNKLKFKKQILKLKKKEIFKAEQALYFMGAYRWHQNSEIIPNMFSSQKNLGLYFKNLNKNLLNKNFLEDKYFINTKKKIISLIK